MNQEQIKRIRKDCISSISDYIGDLEILRGQSLLITGGTGFMGKWLTEAIALLNDEYRYNIQLYLLARNIKDYRERVPHLARQKFIKLIEQDIRNLKELPDDITYIIHAAGSPDSRKHVSNPLKTIDVICKGTQTLLDVCSRLPGLKKFIHVSSNYVYGEQKDGTINIKESSIGVSDPNSVNAAYSESKRMSETICAVYRNQQKLPIIVVRPFAFIGPYQELEKPWAINNFIRDSILGGPIRILGSENTVRSYLYGSDMASWLLKILSSGKAGGTYNLGSDQPVSLRDLTQKITLNFNNKIEVLIRSSKQNFQSPSISVPDNTHIYFDLQVKQRIDMESALEKTIDWYKQSDSRV